MNQSTPTWPVKCEIVLEDMWDKALDRIRDVVRQRCRSRRCYELKVTFRLIGNELKGWTKPEVTEWEPASHAEQLANDGA